MLEDRIVFIDGDGIVIDKPAGLPVDPPRRGGDSISSRANELKLGFKRPPVAMHRLDQDTSGCLLLARNPRSRAEYQQAFERGEVEKVYLAVIAGTLAEDHGAIDLPLVKRSTPTEGWRMVGDPSGKPAVTDWRRLAERDGRTLVEFKPRTGRTHQLRAHAREGLGAPIVGDPFYGGGTGPMMLHAVRLVVPRPGKPAIDVTAPLPPHFQSWSPFVEIRTENVAG